MAVICLMLFVTIGILTTGLSMKKSFEEITKKFTPYDLSCSLNKDNEESNIQTLALNLLTLIQFLKKHKLYQ